MVASPSESPVHPNGFSVPTLLSFTVPVSQSLDLCSTPTKVLLGEISPTLSVELSVTSPERNVKQVYAKAHHGLPILASRNIARLKVKQVPQGEVERVICEEVHYTLKNLNEFSN